MIGGNDATRSVHGPRFHADGRLGIWSDRVAGGEPRLHPGRSAAALYIRRLQALRLGNSRRGANHGLHAPAAREPERGLPQGVRQAVRTIRLGEVVACAVLRQGLALLDRACFAPGMGAAGAIFSRPRYGGVAVTMCSRAHSDAGNSVARRTCELRSTMSSSSVSTPISRR